MKPPRGTRAILAALETAYPDATTELDFRTPWELLVATILSAQTTDQRVNQVTPALFRRFPDSVTLASADPHEVEVLIRPTGFFRQKTRAIVGVAKALVAQHSGRVPAEMSALVELPGVGRKTANVVLGHALGVPGFAVDRHVLRVTNRIGIAESPDPDTVEAQITKSLPPEMWARASDTLILHGRRVCKPRPLCDRCTVRTFCRFAAATATLRSRKPAVKSGNVSRAGMTPQGRGRSARKPRSRA